MADIEKKWYFLRAISGKEAKVKEYLEADLTLSVYGSFAFTLYWKIHAEPCESGTDVFPGGECK